jgi:hypothetical protein
MNGHVFKVLTKFATAIAVLVGWFCFLGPASISAKSNVCPILWIIATALGIIVAISILARKRPPTVHTGEKK